MRVNFWHFMAFSVIVAAILLSLTAWAHGGEPILLDFTASWCQPCQNMRPIVAKLKAEGVDVREVDCSQGIPPYLAGWKVEAFPTFIVIRDKREVVRQKGSCSEAALRRLLKEGGR
jgi:thiol-disulfide isomerase/thioredoxin